MKLHMKPLIHLLFGGGVVTLGVPVAHAALMRASTTTDLVTNQSSTTVITDGASGDVSDGVDGIITLNNGFQTIPGLIINGSNHMAEGVPANPGVSDILSSGSASVFNSSPDPIKSVVTISATDFMPQALIALTTGSGTFISAPGAVITLKWWQDPNNVQGARASTDTPGQLIDTYSFTTASGDESFSYNSRPLPITDIDPFSMTLQFSYVIPSGGSLVSRGQAELAPPVNASEPASFLILGAGALGLFTGRRGVLGLKKSSLDMAPRKQNRDSAEIAC